MKKFSKIMVFVLMLALSIASIFVSPLTVFATAPLLVGVGIQLTKMPTTGSINSAIKIPVGTTNTSGSVVSVTVTDPKGKQVELPTAVDGYYNVLPTMVGEYKVQYTASAVSGKGATTSKVYTIKVTGEKATLSFDSNTPYILPEKVGMDTTLVLPYPNITDSEDNVVVGNYTGEGDNVVSVKATDPEHNNLELGTVSIKTDDTTTKTYYTFKAKADVYGTYALTYSYKNAQNVVVTKSVKVNVSANYSVENQDVTFTWSGSLPTSAVLGNETTLPTPVTVDKNKSNESVDTYTKVTVNFVDAENNKTNIDVDAQDFTFTPKYEAKSGTYYEIRYDIYTLESLKLSSILSTQTFDEYLATLTPTLTKEYTLKNVTDTVAPTPVAVNDYVVEEDGTLTDAVIESLKNVDTNYLIPSKAVTQVAIEIPAIYATDNYDAYKNLTLTRSVLDEDKNLTSLDSNSADSNTTYTIVSSGKTNKSSTIKFLKKGTYTIRYRATDKSGNSSEVSYKIVVSDTLTDNIAPNITMPTIQSSVVPGDTISFSLPTVVDYALDHKTNPSDTTVVDSRVNTTVYWYYGAYDASKDLTGSDVTKLAVDADDSTIYKFDVPADTTESQLTVVVRAEDDAKYATSNTQNNVSFAYRTISIYNVNDDVLPVLETDLSTNFVFDKATSGTTNAYGQNEEVTIPSVAFSDTNHDGAVTSKSLTTSLMVLDKNGNSINISGVQYTYDSDVLTMKNGKFITTVAGEYQIVITATDMGGNSLVNSVYINVVDNKAPVIELSAIPTTMELGQTYKLPSPVLIDDGEVITNSAEMEVKITGPGSGYINHETLEFTPTEKGTYSIVYYGKDSSGNEVTSNVYTVAVSDTIKPVIVLDESVIDGVPAIAEYKDTDGNVIDVELPSFSATDEYDGIKSQEITVKDPDGDVLTVTDDGDRYTFTPNQNGSYTVVYKAVDLAGNETTMEFTVKVGDCQAPAITLTSANKPGTYYIGDTMKLDTTGITVTDNNTTDNTAFQNISTSITNGKLKIVLTTPDSSTVTFPYNDSYNYKFETAGTYTLTYTATDSAGNSDPIVYTFEVKSKTNDTTVSEQSWGIVLIVVSLALLCGVVIYFVKTKDAPTAKLEKSKELTKKSKKDDK